MTCIAGVADGTRVWIGGDSCASTATAWSDNGAPKVFVLGDLLVGIAGSFRVIDLVRFQMPGQRATDEPAERFMRSTFVQSFWDLLKRSDLVSEASFEGEVLVGCAGRLFTVHSDFSVLAGPAWGSAIGTGADAARGSLWTTAGTAKAAKANGPEARILAALGAAEAVVPSVRGPFGVLCSPEEPTRRGRKRAG